MIEHCPNCQHNVPESQYDHPDGVVIDCPVCGRYRLMEEGHQYLIEARYKGTAAAIQPRLSAVLRAASMDGTVPVVRRIEPLLEQYRPPRDPIEAGDRILRYMRAKTRGPQFVPLVGHRDYPVAGYETPEEFNYALSLIVGRGFITQRVLDEATYQLTPDGWAHLRSLDEADTKSTRSGISKLFLSHAAVDRPVAEFVRDEIVRLKPGLGVFLASREGDIRADEDWLAAIQRELRDANAYCVLLTPNSVNRPWVWFETGAAWMSGKPWVIARAGGLDASAIPLPLSVRQSYTLDEAAGAREVLRPLGIELANSEEFAGRIRNLTSKPGFRVAVV
jgi:DNA-binding PadR family transcriptional regulator